MSALNEGGIHGDAIDTGKISMYAVTDPATNAATTSTIIGVYGGAIITTTTTGNSQTLASPTDTTAGKIFVIVNNDTSTNTIPVVANSVTYTIGIGVGQAFIWDGTKWMPTDLGITAIPVTVIQGGTGLSTITDHSVMVGSGTGAVTPISVGATGEILCGSTGADPVFSATPSGLTSLGVTTLNATNINRTGVETGAAVFTIASATTTDLSTATSNELSITGTTTITSFGTVTAGTCFKARFTGALTLTYNGTSMILEGARDIVTEAGDRADLISLGSGNWYVVFHKVNGRRLGDAIVLTRADSNENITANLMRGQTHRCGYARTYLLPTAAVGMNATFRTTASVAVSLDSQGTDSFILAGTTLTAGNKITNGSTIGDTVYVECTIANFWDVYASGTWTDGGA